MKRSRHGKFLIALSMVIALALAAPGFAFAVGSIGGTVMEQGTMTPIDYAGVAVYAWSPTSIERIGGDITTPANPGVWGPVAANDSVSPNYVVRTGRPGYITQDLTPAFPIGGVQVYDPILTPDPLVVERTWAPDRYSTAVSVARERFTSPANPQGWWGVKTVIIASGEDRAAADPLAAAGLCGAYSKQGGAPLLLVNTGGAPASVREAIREISMTYGKPINVVVVGGSVSVPGNVLAQIGAAAPNGVVFDPILPNRNRFELAASISTEIGAVSGVSDVALIANGADSEKFFDALALSTVAAAQDMPILLVNENSIPPETTAALNQLGGSKNIVIGGGPATVSLGVQNQLDAQYGAVERWAGSDRYWTAIDIANNAIAQGLLMDDVVGVAAKLPDALTGGATIGQSAGCLLITNGQTLTPATGGWLSGHAAAIDKCYIVGGPKSVEPGVMNTVASLL